MYICPMNEIPTRTWLKVYSHQERISLGQKPYTWQSKPTDFRKVWVDLRVTNWGNGSSGTFRHLAGRFVLPVINPMEI